jgi:hypothetical protein
MGDIRENTVQRLQNRILRLTEIGASGRIRMKTTSNSVKAARESRKGRPKM